MHSIISYTYSIEAEVSGLQECSQEAKVFSGDRILFSGLTLKWMDVFSILSLTEKIGSIHVSTKVNRESVMLQSGFTSLNCSSEITVSVPKAWFRNKMLSLWSSFYGP